MSLRIAYLSRIYDYDRLGTPYEGFLTRVEVGQELLKSALAFAGTVSDLGFKLADDVAHLLDTVSDTDCPSEQTKMKEEKRLEGVKGNIEKLVRDCEVSRRNFCDLTDRLAQVSSAVMLSL